MNKASERQARYDAKTARKIMLKLHKEHDKDIIDFVESKESMQGIIKIAVREYMKNHPEEVINK